MEDNITINESRISGTMKNGIYYPLQIDLSDYSLFQREVILALTECCEKETINVNKFTRWLEKNVDTLDEENQRAPGYTGEKEEIMYSVNYFSTEDKKWIECNNNLTEEEVKNALTWYRKNDPDTDYRVREITGVDFLDW